MAGDVRSRMVESAAVLLAKNGFQGTSFSSVLEASKTPRGSIYHHFPEGKDQLIAAAIDLVGEGAVAALDRLDGQDAGAIVDAFMRIWRSVLERSDLSAGCSVLAVTVSSESAELVERAGRIFRTWGARLADLFVAAGLDAEIAGDFAVTVISAAEGAVVVARAEHDFAPFDAVHRQLRRMAGSPS